METGFTQAPSYILRALDAYNLQPVHVMPPQKGYRNQSFGVQLKNDATLNFILYKNEPDILSRIKRTNRVANFVANAGLPARKSFDPRILRLQGEHETRFGALYYYLSGNTIAWEAYTMQHIKLLGKGLGDMHAALKGLPKNQSLPSVALEYAGILERMQDYFAHMPVQRAIQQKLGLSVSHRVFQRLRRFVQACDNLPDQQALHMDFVRGNILFSNQPQLHISGILDFEKTGQGHVMFDIARTLAFLLVDCKHKTHAQVWRYFLDSGYNKRSKSSVRKTNVRMNGASYDLLDTLIDLFLLHDFYKFLRHNPYESLAQNQHYLRTRQLLIDRNLVVINKTVFGISAVLHYNHNI